ncbi:MAG: DUF1850 domain-containing protein [Treponema sp.]|jgi:hypothetical protein|nr:DUF1850 domain-containing protein [Treponema sp.]
MKVWYGLVFNLILAALVISGAVFFKTRAEERGVSLLVARDSRSGKKYGSWTLPEGGEFSIEFIHSVNQTPVRDTFKIEKKRIWPVAARFSSFGAGMQTALEEEQAFSREGDFLVITGFTQSYRELNYIVGTVSDHILWIRDEPVSLRDLCGKNAHVRFRVEGGFAGKGGAL